MAQDDNFFHNKLLFPWTLYHTLRIIKFLFLIVFVLNLVGHKYYNTYDQHQQHNLV